MRIILMAFLGLLSAAVSTSAQETRLVTDHAGYQVAIPAKPKRVITLNDWTLTVMAHELGASLIGSAGRIEKDGSYFIRSARELYGLSFDDVEMASIHGMYDVERIAALKPDLIMATLGDTLPLRGQLSLIAPTIFFDPMNGIAPIDKYRQVAGWLGLEDRFEALDRQYRTRIEKTRTAMFGGEKAPSYVAIIPEPQGGTVRVFRDYGSLTTVLDDLGFRQGAVTALVPDREEGSNVSAEMIGMLDTDYIFTTHMPQKSGSGTDAMLKQLDEVAPGYRVTLPAVREGRFLSLSRFHTFPTSFAAMNYVLDTLCATNAACSAVPLK